jgi:hypothetical protein
VTEFAQKHSPPCNWTPTSRSLVFFLAASSIGCLLLDFYHLYPMRLSTPSLFAPCAIALFVLALFDRRQGDGELWRAVLIGATAGLLAAWAYDIFRLPFVFSEEWGLSAVVPPMKLFKVFPRFGAMILGQPIEQAGYSPSAQILGWLYHFSNGTTFGIMYVAMIGNPARRHWAWAVLMALGLELGMLLTPYPVVFHIPVTVRFVVVTLSAHAIFGVGLGLAARKLASTLHKNGGD